MKHSFSFWNPTRIHFGQDSISHLKEELSNYKENVLLLYGKGSIKKIGLYDEVVSILKKAGKKVTELGGISPNPRYSEVQEGARLVRENDIDLILAVGGGSVIDAAKAISATAYAKGDPWKRYWINEEDVDNKVVNIGTILTMTGTGSEMNGGSVVTNEKEKIKTGRVFPPTLYPRFSILNPEYTYSVPSHQMVSGIFDIFSHLMEQYFSGDDDNVSDYLIEGLMESLIRNSRIAIKDPKNYEARSNIMWCSTVALNRIVGVSKTQDWQVHNAEHQLGAYTDCPHGLGLAVISIPYFKYIYKYGLDKFVRFATKVWNVDAKGKSKEEVALLGIDALSLYIKELGIPQTLRELGATEDMLVPIAKTTVKCGGYKKMNDDDILAVLKACF